MKRYFPTKTLLYFLFVTFAFQGFLAAQAPEISPQRAGNFPVLYLGWGAGMGSTFGTGTFGIHLTTIGKNHWGVSASSKFHHFEAINLPDDYVGEYRNFWYNTEPEIPQDEMTTTSLKLVREFPLTESGIRLGVEAGPSWVFYEQYQFYPRPRGNPNSSLVDRPSHEKEKYIRNTLGAEARVRATIPFADWIGMEVAGVGLFNRYQNFYGGEVYFLFGKVR